MHLHSQSIDPASRWLLRLAAVRSRGGPQRASRHGALTILLACLTILAPATVHGETATDLPKNIRIVVEYIEVPHELVTEVMVSEPADSGPGLHARMRALMKDGKAKVLETSILTTRSGQKATVESVMEHIYPTEVQPIYWIGCGGGPPPPRPEGPPRARPVEFVAFETRNVGVTLDIDPILLVEKGLVELRFTQDITNLLRYETWFEYHDRWGDTSIRMPIYESLASKNVMTLHDGKFGFLGVLTPTQKDGGPDTTRKIMLFVRADVMTIGP